MSDSVSDDDKKELAKRFRRLIRNTDEENVVSEAEYKSGIDSEPLTELKSEAKEETGDNSQISEDETNIPDIPPPQGSSELELNIQDEKIPQLVDSVSSTEISEPVL